MSDRYLLTQHPDAQARVVQELRSSGIPCNGNLQATVAALSLDLLKELPYCTAVLHEAMRIFPAGVAATPRYHIVTVDMTPHTHWHSRWFSISCWWG